MRNILVINGSPSPLARAVTTARRNIWPMKSAGQRLKPAYRIGMEKDAPGKIGKYLRARY